MKFPNALNGVKKIRTSEILSLIVSLLGGVGGALVLTSIGSAKTAEQAIANGGGALIGGGIVAAIAGILGIISFILQLVGLNAAGKDEKNFRQGFILALVGIVVSVLQTAFASNNLLSSAFELISSVITPIITYLVINGIINLARKLGNDAMVARGMKLFKFIIVGYAISIIIKLIETIFTNNATMQTVVGVLAIVAAVISIIVLVTYLKYLGRAVKMLER